MAVEDLTAQALRRWSADGRRFAAALLVEIIGSAPLDPGAMMLVDDEGLIEGSVTGGCVEGALAEEAARVLDGGPARLLTYGISDELAGDVGLMCGGTVRILVHEITADIAATRLQALDAVDAGRGAAVATVLTGPAAGGTLAVVGDRRVGRLGAPELLEHAVEQDAAGALVQGVSMVRRYGDDGTVMGNELEVFIHAFATPPRMIIVGAIDFSAAVARYAKDLGYAVTICDARQAFLASDRFSAVAEVVQQWPDAYLERQTLGERDAVLVFSHDSKFDEPALTAALESGAGYIGAMGSRRTATDRTRRLRKLGIPGHKLARISSPCGLDIGAATPGETAVSVLAEIIALRTGRHGRRLVETSGSIRDTPAHDVPTRS